MRERARAAAWWLNCARGSSLLCLLATRPGRSGYKPHSPISRPNVLNHIAKPHPQRTSDLVRGHQATDSSTRSRAADLRPRLMPSRGIRLPAARPEPPHQTSSTTLPPPATNSECGRTGRPRSQDPITGSSPQPPTSAHPQAQRPLAHSHCFTHSGPLTSSGASRPRTAARVAVLRTSDLA